MTRALRIGVLLGGNLVEEKLFTGTTTPITFGQSLRCAVSIPGDGIPHEHALFVFDQGPLILRATSSMSGRFAHGGSTTTFTTLTAGDHALQPGVRGKIVIGDATLLFQELAAAPASPRPVLPASVRGTLGDRIDRRLAAIIGASVLLHLGIAGYAWMTDLETTSMLETPVASIYHHDTMEITLPDEPTPVEPTQSQEPGAATPVSPTQVTPTITPTRPKLPGEPKPPKAPTSMSVEDAQRFASVLTGSEVGRDGVGPMRDRTPGADLQQQIDDVGNRPVEVGNPDGDGFRQQHDGHIGTDHGPNITDPTQVASNEPKNETEPKGRIKVKPLPGEKPDTTLTVAAVLDKINTVYMPGLQRCYKKGLVDDATLQGKIAMAFTVTERGTLDEQSAAGVSGKVDSCVTDFMSTWRFPIPKDKDGDPSEQSFKLSLQLTPN
ncbi:MAG: AgmX/PglI C-terminal domain-containing protein [Kofleriaceae bacterium]